MPRGLSAGPCATGLQEAAIYHEGYERDRWLLFCADGMGLVRGPWKIVEADGKVLNSGMVASLVAPDAGAQGP